MKEVYLSLFLSVLGSLVAYRLVCSSAWLSKALRNLAPTLYTWFMLGFPLFLLGPMAAICSNDYTIFTVLNLFFICFLFLYLIFYFYGRRESEEVYTWLLLNTKIRVTVVTFLILSLVAFWYFSFLEVTLDIILSLSLVEILDFLSTRFLSVLSPLIVNFYWLLYSYTWVIKYVSSMPILLLVSNGFVSGIVIRGFYSSIIGLDMLSFLLETGKVADCSIAMFRAIGVKSSFASLVAERPSTSVFLKQISTWEKPNSLRFLKANKVVFFERELPWEELSRGFPLHRVEKFICELPITETTLHHKIFVMHYTMALEKSGLGFSKEVSQKVFLKLLADLKIDSVEKAKAYGFKVAEAEQIGDLTFEDLNVMDIANAKKQLEFVKELLLELPPEDLVKMFQYTFLSYSRDYPFVLTESWHNNFVVRYGIKPRAELLFQLEAVAYQYISFVDCGFDAFDQAKKTYTSTNALFTRRNEVVGIGAEQLTALKLGNSVKFLQPAVGVGNADVVYCYGNGDVVNVDLTQPKNPYFRPYFSHWTLDEKNTFFSVSSGVALLDKQVKSNVKVQLDFPFIQQSSEVVREVISTNLTLAYENLLEGYKQQISDEDLALNKVINQRVSKNELSQKMGRIERLFNQVKQAKNISLPTALKNTTITTSENYKR